MIWGAVLRQVYLSAIFIAIGLTTLTSDALAQLRVNKMIAILGPETRGRADFELYNSSENTIYLSNKLFVVPDPINRAERTELTDPRNSPVVVTPRDLVLGPGDRRLIRVFTTGDPADVDRVFRLTVNPQPQDFESSATSVQVLVGYDLLIIQPPESPNAAYNVTRDGVTLTVANSGNTNVFFDRIEYCPTEDEECTSLGARRVYAGETSQFDVDGAGKVRLRYRTDQIAETIER